MPNQKKWLASGSSYATPYYDFQTRRKGPAVMVVAGIHGNETASIQAAKQLVDRLSSQELALKKGRLVIVPVVHQTAYRKRIRGIPDLNRTFPRGSGKKAGHPLSAALYQLAVRLGPAWYLDLHEANGLSQINPKRLGQTLITQPGSRAVPALRKLIRSLNHTIPIKSRHFNLRLHELPGSSRTAVARVLKSRAVTVETCWSLDKAERVRYQVDVVSGLLRVAGLLK
ncbi:succinylglutamate desuccinylase/aspartoacylase family protein [Fontibacillus sp. BL9]|uniref:succinylglutamate desuccinylase/aspartoacylase domain-containing protein n=1 Tax=Fontibacillus sp. BL9 TaxID=3389971 RepID=UPI00397B00AD